MKLTLCGCRVPGVNFAKSHHAGQPVPPMLSCCAKTNPAVEDGCLPTTTTTSTTTTTTIDEPCFAPKNAVGYKVTENSLHWTSFDVTATCADRFYGHAHVKICTKPDMVYYLSGCVRNLDDGSRSRRSISRKLLLHASVLRPAWLPARHRQTPWATMSRSPTLPLGQCGQELLRQ